MHQRRIRTSKSSLFFVGLWIILSSSSQLAAKAAHDAVPNPTLNKISRKDFNRIAAELALPIFWIEDRNHDHSISPDELAILWNVRSTTREEWVNGKIFSKAFVAAYENMVDIADHGHTEKGLNSQERKRHRAILKELAQGRPTLILTDVRGASSEDRALIHHFLEVAQIIEKLYARQRGVLGMADEIPVDDVMSRMLFYRNQGPWCSAPATESDPNCNALARKPKKISGLYPTDTQKNDKKFCEKLSQRPDAEKLLQPFDVVLRGQTGNFIAVPYNEAFGPEIQEVSHALQGAAHVITSRQEMPLKKYLLAAAQSFLDNNWLPADEAWAAMNAQNSKWYVRVAPDEVYFEPCNRKAGFHMTFASIDQTSLTWQRKLNPIKGDMEKELARLAGEPYRARKVAFHLPDFINIILNAGDDRSPLGGTIGQSLPNWGPIVGEGRGRTVVMANLYTDADSKKARREQAASLFCPTSMTLYNDDHMPEIMSTVLHEATHNLGPAHEYKVDGKTDAEIFGGRTATMLEELKAQTGALYFTHWLTQKKLIPKDTEEKSYTKDVVWMFGHIANGMYESNGKPKPYSQLAAIQFGWLLKAGAISWNPEEMASNTNDRGCFTLHLEQFPTAIEQLTSTVTGIKARGDRPRAESLKKEFVDVEGEMKKLRHILEERWRRSPKASFVYSIEF